MKSGYREFRNQKEILCHGEEDRKSALEKKRHGKREKNGTQKVSVASNKALNKDVSHRYLFFQSLALRAVSQ